LFYNNTKYTVVHYLNWIIYLLLSVYVYIYTHIGYKQTFMSHAINRDY